MLPELIGDEIWLGGFLVARLVEGAPPSIRADFEAMLREADEDLDGEFDWE